MMNIRLHSFFLALSCLAGGVFASGIDDGAAADEARVARVAHVIVIGVDGLSPDGIANADAPNIRRMMAQGSWSMHARAVMPTTSSANWASILGGAGPEQHGVTSNDWRPDEYEFPTSTIGSGAYFPSIFQLVAEQRPELEVGSIYEWGGFATLYDPRFVDHDAQGRDSRATAALAMRYIQRNKPGLLFVHLDLVDHVGHRDGHGTPAYYAAVSEIDAIVGDLMDSVDAAGMADDTVLILTSDHGGIGKGHGGNTLAELEIPWIVSGKHVRQGHRLVLPINTFDTPATIAWLLGIDIPYAWLGRPIKSILEGEAAPRLLHAPSNIHPAPVIHPQEDGGAAPSGALFAAGGGRFSIDNPAGIGEIRYTTDNTTPTIDAALYSGPVKISRNTVVRAGLFVDGKPASTVSRAEYRVLEDPAASGVYYRLHVLPQPVTRLPELSALEPVASGVTHEFALDGLPFPREQHVAAVFDAFVRIDTAGEYTFATTSDDGSKLYIGERLVVDNDGNHGLLSTSGSIRLEPGRHPIRVEWFNGVGGAWLGAYFRGPGVEQQRIDPNRLTPRRP